MSLIEIRDGIEINPDQIISAVAVINTAKERVWRLSMTESHSLVPSELTNKEFMALKAAIRGEPSRYVSELPLIKRILITVEGGVIQDVCNVPQGIEVEVRDFDVEGVDSKERIRQDDDGNEYLQSIYG